MLLLEISTDQIIAGLVIAILATSGAVSYMAKIGWEWLKGQFNYLTARIEKLEIKMDSERKYLESKLDQERDEQDTRIDNLFEKVLSKMKTEKLDLNKLEFERKQNG